MIKSKSFDFSQNKAFDSRTLYGYFADLILENNGKDRHKEFFTKMTDYIAKNSITAPNGNIKRYIEKLATDKESKKLPEARE